MSEETPQEKPRYDPSTWARENPVYALIISMVITAVLSFGGNQVANKVQAQNPGQGMTQEQADGKYLTIQEANRRADKRDKDQVSKDLFEERTKSINEKIDLKTKAIEDKIDTTNRMLADLLRQSQGAQ